MIYHAFHKQWVRQGCVSTHQIYAWHPRFDKNNLVRWVRQGLLVRLKNGLYTFPECLEEPGFAYVAAGCIYRPSYISLQAALAFYGLIPEAVATITSISTRKTASFHNQLAHYAYQQIKPGAFQGYDLLHTSQKRQFKMARPAKALVDLLYLYPFYADESDMLELRLDPGLFQEKVNRQDLRAYAEAAGQQALLRRVNILINTYQE